MAPEVRDQGSKRPSCSLLPWSPHILLTQVSVPHTCPRGSPPQPHPNGSNNNSFIIFCLSILNFLIESKVIFIEFSSTISQCHLLNRPIFQQCVEMPRSSVPFHTKACVSAAVPSLLAPVRPRGSGVGGWGGKAGDELMIS